MNLRARVIALLTVGAMALPVMPATAVPAPAGAPVGEVVPGELLVKWAPSARANERAAERARHGLETAGQVATSGYEQLTMDAGRDPRAVAADLRRRGAVAAAQPNFVYELAQDPASSDDPYFSSLWGLHNTGQTINSSVGVADVDLDVPEAWATTRGTAEVVVAVIDTGVEWDHPDLVDRVWTNAAEATGTAGRDDDGNGFADDVHGWNFFNDTAQLYDPTTTDDNHGTHVAGTIAASAGNTTGVAGVAPGVRVMPVKFMGRTTSGISGTTTDAIAAIEYAADNGADIINASWGASGTVDSALATAISASGTVFVAAAGNAATNTDATPYWPATLDAANIVAVAAVNNRGGLASFSSYGATTIDLGAPGVSILSSVQGDTAGGNYAWMDGTSMAAPHVAGVAALLASAAPTLTVAEIISLLKTSATANPLASLDGRTVTGGMPNAATALDLIAAPTWNAGAALAASDVTSTSFTVTWPAASDNVAVVDHLVTVGSAEAVAVADLDHAVSGLTPATSYVVSVRPRDGAGQLGPALSTTVTTTSLDPVWPSGAALAASDVTTSGFTVSWPHASDDVAVTGYRVTVDDNTPVTLDATVTSHQVTGPEATDHAVTVVALDRDGRTSAPLTATIRTLSTTPEWPSGAAITASSVTTTGFTVSWPAATDDVAVTAYGVTVGTAPEVVVTDRTLVVDGLSASTAYPVTIVARDADGHTSPTLTATVTTAAPPATGGGGGGGGGGGFPAPTEPIEEEPVETAPEDGTVAEPTTYDGTVARSLELACPSIPPHGWTDVPASSPHADGIGCATAWDVFVGGTSATFSPDQRLSRGQLASVLARAIEQATGSTMAAGTDQFSDDDDSVHAAAIDKLAAVGIVGGVDATTYAPTASVTRAQFAAMLARTYRHLVWSLPTGGDAFGDDDDSVHEASIDALAVLGIVTGDGAGSYSPGAVLTRAQSATMVARLIDALVEAGATV